ncbi:MAG: hypothetical protein CM1200mP28_15930 [Deltaproteobacteria bacterium]|nr:MAG: hypothetical protein CM1200mP28_15930 [Deltaproteobacteria bacterium]
MESPEHNLIVIGDPKQAIYSFRGADIFTYMQARRVFAENYSQAPVSLTKNFRSSELLLCGLNRIFGSSYWLPEEKGLEYINVGAANLNWNLKTLLTTEVQSICLSCCQSLQSPEKNWQTKAGCKILDYLRAC